MASPFTIFRKHQKVLLAVLGLLAMIAFVFLPNLGDSRNGGASRNPYVVTTKKYGNLTEEELGYLIGQRNTALGFYERLYQAMGFQIPMQPPSEEEVVETWILSNRAKELGLVVSNDAINASLQNTTGDRVSHETIATILKQMGISDRQLFQVLRSEMAARQMVQMFNFSVAPATPAQRWDYYLRLNRRATVEFAAEPVAKYVGQVEDPDESTLREFFEQYKDNHYRPDSPDPGFRRPHRIALEYFKAEIDKFLDPASITEEQMKEYYEKNKDTYYLRGKLPEVEKKPDSTPEKPAPKPDDKPKPEEQPSPKPEEKPKVEEPAPPAKPAGGEAEKSSAAENPSPFRVVSFAEEKPSAEPAKAPVPAAKPEPEAPAPKPEPPPKPEPAPETKPEPAPEKKPEPAPETKPEPASETKPEPAPETKPGEKAPESKYVPYEEAKNDIRDVLARGQAQAKIERTLEKLRDRMTDYSQSLSASLGKGTTAPEPLDMHKLAAEHGLTFRSTGMVSEVDAQQLDIGRSFMRERQDRFLNFAFQGRPTFQPAVSQDLDAYYLFWKVDEAKEAVPSLDDSEALKLDKEAEKAARDGNEQEAAFLTQKAAQARQETKRLREQVVETWKMVQARSLARDRAAALAAVARKSGKPLKEALAGEAGVRVIETGPFSWLTQGAVPPSMFTQAPPPRISFVNQVNVPGDEFMETVFSLEPGETGVALNKPKTVAYVVQVKSFEPSLAVLWQLFLAVPYDEYKSAALADQHELYKAWMDEIKASIGFKWERKPYVAPDR